MLKNEFIHRYYCFEMPPLITQHMRDMSTPPVFTALLNPYAGHKRADFGSVFVSRHDFIATGMDSNWMMALPLGSFSLATPRIAALHLPKRLVCVL